MENLYNYIDDLLRLQSGAVDKHNHRGVLGSIREEFVHSEICQRIDDIRGRLHRGEIYFGSEEFGQHDIILRKKGVDNPVIGGQVRIEVRNVAAVVEVKSNAKLTEITKFDTLSGRMKKINPDIVCGMFCYKISGKSRTVIERAGFYFDRDCQSFIPGARSNSYKNMDFILCLDDAAEVAGVDHAGKLISYSKFFFLKLDSGYVLHHSPPFSNLLLNELRRSDQGGLS